MDVLLIAPYCGGSHQSWAQGFVQHSRNHVQLLALPARFWKWRMHGGAATLAEMAEDREAKPDALLVTDMLNLPAFLGLMRQRYSDVPAALYCHENQLTYPLQAGEKRDLTYGVINWLSMLAADSVFFNSTYHLEAWFDELPRLLKHFPDYSHVHRIPEVRAKARVLPVGCELTRIQFPPPALRLAKEGQEPPLILWNQRWEYDKDPATFFRALDALVAEGIAFRVALAGSNTHQQPTEFEAARERLGARVIHFGRADEASYVRLLSEADVVVSTALHEFFGVAVVEAIAGGCFPVLPKRLVYPEILPAAYHPACLYASFEGLVERLRWALTHRQEARELAAGLQPVVRQYDWSTIAPLYDRELEALIHPSST